MRFLIVDDTESDRILTANVLKDLCPDSHIDLSSTVPEARRKLMASKYDLLLLDIRLGADDGLLFLNELRNSEHECFRNQHAYILSGAPSTLDKLTGAVLDVNYVEKGFSVGELRKQLSTVVDDLKGNRSEK